MQFLKTKLTAIWRATVALEDQAVSLRSSEHDVLTCRSIYLSAAYSISLTFAVDSVNSSL